MLLADTVCVGDGRAWPWWEYRKGQSTVQLLRRERVHSQHTTTFERLMAGICLAGRYTDKPSRLNVVLVGRGGKRPRVRPIRDEHRDAPLLERGSHRSATVFFSRVSRYVAQFPS